MASDWAAIRLELGEWREHPEDYEDDGQTPATLETITLAEKVLDKLQETEPVPDRTVMGVNGDIIFEWQRGNESKSARVWDGGQVERFRFVDHKLVERTLFVL